MKSINYYIKLAMLLAAGVVTTKQASAQTCVTPVITTVSATSPVCEGGTIFLNAAGTVGGVSSAYIRMAAIGGNAGNQEFNELFSTGDRAGTITRMTNATFDAIMASGSTASARAALLKAQYDVLMFTWASPYDGNITWPLLEAYMDLGGSIFWDGDYANIGNLAAGGGPVGTTNNGSSSCSYVLVTPAPFPVLVSNGINGCFTNHHLSVSSWPSWMQAYIKAADNTTVVAIAGIYPGGNHGRLIIQGPDQDYHACRCASTAPWGGGTPGNQYQIMLNQMDFLSANQAGFTWSGPGGFTSSDANPTITNATSAAAGTYTATLTNTTGGGCSTSATVNVTVVSAPTAYAVTGGGSYCSGTSGPAIGLANSATGVSYQLRRGTTNVGSAVSGTGAAISFGSQSTVVTYSVLATSSAGCTSAMTGSTTITVVAAPAIFSMTGGGSFCSGGSGVSVGLNGSQSGVSYQLRNGTTNVGSPVSGTGSTLSFGAQTTAGSYNVLATNSTGCTSTMSGSATVVVNALPVAYNVTGGGAYCEGGSGVSIGLSNSQSGVSYQLRTGGANSGSAVSGTGSAINFGNRTTVGNYTVVATNSSTGCANAMSGSADVSTLSAPAITVCPSNASVNVAGGTCGAAVSYSAATVTGSSPTVTYSHASGSTFSVGTTNVSVNATNSCGSASCSFAVVVSDNENPTISAPANVTVNANSGACNATGYDLGTATTSDNCGVASVTNNDAGSYAVGTHNITWTVTDVHGNSATATQTITVVDNQNPTIAAPANVTVNANSGACNATGYDLGSATTADNCGVASVTNNDAGSYAVGTHNITWTVTDVNGNSATATQTITVVDNQNPSITAPANVTVNANTGACNATGYDLGSATTADNCGVASVTNNDAGSYAVGTHNITWTVTDVHGNSSTATQTITVVDNQNPAITAPANITVNANSGVCNATGYELGSATTADNCGVASVTNNDAGSYAVGTHNITWTVTDVNGNSSTATQTITVVDNQNPVAVCQNYTLNLSGGVGTISASNIDNGSSDNCGIASMTVSPSSFTCANAGANTVTLTVTDVNGNVSSCTSTVTVQYQPTASISVTPANTTYTGGVVTTIYLGYGPQSATLTANATGGSGFSYSWSSGTYLSCTSCQSPVFTPTAAGNYTYTVTATNSNGCSTTATVTLCVIDARDAAHANKVLLCHVPPGNPSAANTLSIAASAVPSHLTNHSGDRLGTCSSSCGASAKESAIPAEVASSNGFTMLVYPNPTNSDIHVDIESDSKDAASVFVYDVAGRVMETKNNQSVDQSITVGANLPAGVYILDVRQNNVSHKVKITKL